MTDKSDSATRALLKALATRDNIHIPPCNEDSRILDYCMCLEERAQAVLEEIDQ